MMALPTIFSPSKNCWRIEKADEFSILIDANDYFGPRVDDGGKAADLFYRLGL
jgi:hypothetical protein